MSLVRIFEHKFYDRHCDYFQFNLLLPDFVIWRKEENSFGDQSRNIRINFATKLVFHVDKDIWFLEVKLFGFGFGMTRQWSY